jgi:sugar phosphate isomerase/epimerase
LKLSISNIAWTAEDDELVISRLPEYGVEGLEIAPTRIIPDLPYRHIPAAVDFAAKLRREAGLSICSMQSIWYKRTESIFGTPEEVKSLIDYTREAILFAEAIGCPNLVFGCPKNRIIPEGRSREEAMDFFCTIGDIAAEHNTVIALEAVPVTYGTNFLNTSDDLYDFVSTAGSEGLRMNLDFGTMLVNAEDPADIGRYIPLVNHVHISENGLACVERREEHKVFLRALEAAGYDRFVSIEMRNQEDPEKVFSVVDYLSGLMS